MTVTSASQTQYTQATNKTIATKATSAYETIAPSQTQQTDKMAEMKVKYKDIYTPIPETYSKADEELQTTKVKEAYPNYMTGPEFLKLVDQFYDGEPMKLGQVPTKDQLDKQKIAFDKAYEVFGGQEAHAEMVKGSFAVMAQYPVNNYGKDERVQNATELSRFENAAVYEGLESGKTIGESILHAKGLISSFMYSRYETDIQTDTLGRVGMYGSDDWRVPERHTDNKIDFNYVNNNIMDLQKYGIEGDWGYYDIHDNQKDMIAEIEKKIKQFDFMLNNEKLIKEAYGKLKPEYQNLGNNAGYQKIINDEGMPTMQEGLNIFKNYKIYDSIDAKA